MYGFFFLVSFTLRNSIQTGQGKTISPLNSDIIDLLEKLLASVVDDNPCLLCGLNRAENAMEMRSMFFP
jgi:hypothetical protein